MPKILETAVKKMMAKGMSKNQAYAIATASLQKSGSLKKGTNKPTKKGTKRGQMTEAQRTKSRIPKAKVGGTFKKMVKGSAKKK